MMEKQKMLEDKYAEEMIYAELWKRDIQSKNLSEQQKIAMQKDKVV